MAGKTTLKTIRFPAALEKDIQKMSQMYFSGSFSKTVISACRNMVDQEVKRQNEVLNGK